MNGNIGGNAMRRERLQPGASASPGSFGLNVLRNLEQARFAGDIYLVNPRRSMTEDRPCLPSVAALVEAMGERGAELIVGTRNDPDWGPVLLVGFGGVLAEALHDVRLLPPDLPKEEIVEELLQLKSAAVLKGFRGSPALDVAAAAEIVARLGRLLRSVPSIREVDINPVVVYAAGRGAVALDALIVTA
jgi:acyl-CoA synthetase (NDP forming)